MDRPYTPGRKARRSSVRISAHTRRSGTSRRTNINLLTTRTGASPMMRSNKSCRIRTWLSKQRICAIFHPRRTKIGLHTKLSQRKNFSKVETTPSHSSEKERRAALCQIQRNGAAHFVFPRSTRRHPNGSNRAQFSSRRPNTARPCPSPVFTRAGLVIYNDPPLHAIGRKTAAPTNRFTRQRRRAGKSHSAL